MEKPLVSRWRQIAELSFMAIGALSIPFVLFLTAPAFYKAALVGAVSCLFGMMFESWRKAENKDVL